MFIPVRATILVAISLLGADARRLHAATYSFDSKHAEVSFTYYVGFISQLGRFTRLDGLFQFDARAPERGFINAVIKTASLTANAWESELKGSSFFNVAVFPEIRFKSRSVKPASGNSAEFTGDLTMNGVTQPMTLRAVFEPSAPPGDRPELTKSSPRVTATAHIKRSAFNMSAFSYLVGDQIEIKIEASLIEKQKSVRASD